MKLSTKRQLREFVELIDFPIIIYTYETGKLIASNSNARRILGEDITNINLVWENKGKLRFSTELLENRSEIHFKRAVIQKGKRIEIDVEFSSIPIDDNHIIIGIFEQSYRQIFSKSRILQLPRIIWRDKKLNMAGGNTIFCDDAKIIDDEFSYLHQKEIETEEWKSVCEEEKRLLEEKTVQASIIKSIPWGKKGRRFVKINRFPLTNKNGTAVGILIMYQAILEKEEYEKLFDGVLKENNILGEAVRKNKIIVLSREESVLMPVEYISPNVTAWGYQANEFYSGKITWKDIIYEEDKIDFYKRVNGNSFENKFKTQVYRVLKKNGDVTWIQEEMLGTSICDNKAYCQSIIKEIGADRTTLES